MPAQYGIHTSTIKFMLLIECNVEQFAGHCIIMKARYNSVTLMRHQLNWHFQQHQKITILSLLYKALYKHIGLQVPPYYILSHSNTRVII